MKSNNNLNSKKPDHSPSEQNLSPMNEAEGSLNSQLEGEIKESLGPKLNLLEQSAEDSQKRK